LLYIHISSKYDVIREHILRRRTGFILDLLQLAEGPRSDLGIQLRVISLETKSDHLTVVLSYMCMLFGFSLFGIFAWSLRSHYYFPTEVYWLSFILVSIPFLFNAIFGGSDRKLRLICLLSYSIMIHLQYAVVDSSPLISSFDALSDYRLTGRVVANHEWLTDLEPGFGLASEYIFYPITNFLYAITSMLTGIPLILVCKYLLFIRAFVVPPLIYRCSRNFFDRKVSYLATGFFLSSPGSILFPHKETLALIFFIAGIYVITEIVKTRKFLLIGLLSTLTLIMTHHLTTYVFLGLLTSLFFASTVFKRQSISKPTTQFLMFSYVFFGAWISFVAWRVMSLHERLLSEVFFRILMPQPEVLLQLMQPYVPYEKTIIWVGYAITLISASLGFLYYLRDRKNRSFAFVTITFFLLAFLILATVFRFAPSPTLTTIIVSHRAYEFGFFCVAPLSALFFIKNRSKKRSTVNVVLICAMIIMMITGPMAGMLHPQNFSEITKVISFSSLSLSTWTSQFTRNEIIIGDKVVRMTVSGYGSRSIISYPAELLTEQDSTFNSGLTPKTLYVVTYLYMEKSIHDSLTRKVDTPYFNSVYTNGLFTTYGATLNMTSL